VVETTSNPEWVAFTALAMQEKPKDSTVWKQAAFLRNLLMGGQRRESGDFWPHCDSPEHLDQEHKRRNQGPIASSLLDFLREQFAEFTQTDKIGAVQDPVGNFILRRLTPTSKEMGWRNVQHAGRRKYTPEPGAAPFGILTALFEAANPSSGTDIGRSSLIEKEVRYEAQRWCSSDLTATPAWSNGHGAWDQLTKLQDDRKLIRVENDMNRSDGQLEQRYTLLGDRESAHPDLAGKCASFMRILYNKTDKVLLDPLSIRVPPQGQLVLLVDDREKPDFRERLKNFCQSKRVNFEERRLPVGDYLWVYRSAEGVSDGLGRFDARVRRVALEEPDRQHHALGEILQDYPVGR
jgi:hypothetical protein